MSNGGRKLSVFRELAVLYSSVESLRVLARQKLNGAFHGENISELAITMAGALHVLGDRVLTLQSVLLGRTDPAELLCPSNEVDACRSGPFILSEWSHEERVRRTMHALQADCYRKAVERLASRKSDDKGRSN